MHTTPFYCNAGELAEGSAAGLPGAFKSQTHLIYSSPATLAFNSPGAEGFGVKRAGLSVPDSVMLLVSPGCCGRNTTGLGDPEVYRNRIFYLEMEETDLVTGRHLTRIPQAVREILTACPKKPSVVMLCITCADALLGTDMERVCRKAEEVCQVPVRPCYMYALTREGRKPPMVHVRQSLYSLLEPVKRKASSVNILGFFAPLQPDCELYGVLEGIGVRRIREIAACRNYEEYLRMAEANFNLVLHPEARAAAADLEERLRIPSIELKRLYQTDKIRTQYLALGQALGADTDCETGRAEAEEAVRRFRVRWPGASFSVGEILNGDPFELAVALVKYGFAVKEIFGTPGEENLPWIRRLAAVSPETRIYSNSDPSMAFYEPWGAPDFVIGKDACYYHPGTPGARWQTDLQPFGYAGVKWLFETLSEAGKEVGR